ncbi:MAG TPA: enoyl-CoA hydratase-related protein [Stellaceae bacterium]|nr:enoyl-CoA hydratase-related protein [Stellaceae bacterium]
MTYEFIRVAAQDHVTTITLNRPEVLNAVKPEMHAELQQAFDDFAAAEDQYIAVVTGAGERAFCAGSDLKAAAARGIPATAYPRNGYAGLIERYDLTKPLIAAVNGVALGGGFEIALACDIIIAAETARFGLPEPLVGAVALGGGLHRLARQIGLKPAMGLILSSEPVSAAEGLRLGFVNEVVPPAELDDAVARWCRNILRGAPLAIRASKEAVMRGLGEPSLEAAMRRQPTYPGFALWRNAEDTLEGPRAFAEKRKPRWQGR